MITVLVVDDSPLFASGIQMLIEAQPEMRSVGVASNGTEAIASVRARRPDVVLMDLRMPVMSGIDATRAVLAEPNAPAPRVIVLTTIQKDEAVYQAFRAGASAFLTKDATPDRLLATIRDTVEDRELPEREASMRLVTEFADDRGDDGVRRRLHALTARERDVFQLVTRGLGNGEIAATLHLSEATVKSHVRSVLAKLGTTTRVQLVVFAYENQVHRHLGWPA